MSESFIFNFIFSIAGPALWVPLVFKASKNASSYTPSSLITSGIFTGYWFFRGLKNDPFLAMNSAAWIIVYIIILIFYFQQFGFKIKSEMLTNEWKEWFAWRPVTTIDGDFVWLEKVERRRENAKIDNVVPSSWTVYKKITKNDSCQKNLNLRGKKL